MKNFLLLLALIPILTACSTQERSAEEQASSTETASISSNQIQLMFYNVENLFDTVNTPGKRDGEFTPDGRNNWNRWRYRDKLQNIAKVVMNTQSWQPPVVIGVCEIENREVLEDLISSTSLVKYGYRIVHRESPDERGIDVALLYRKDYVEMIGSKAYEVRFPHDTSDRTRDILMTTGVIGDDTLHFFVNHWPSRYGGVQKSQPDRIAAANTLRKAVDSLFAVDANKKIVIMGDFNDGPENKSVSEVLGAVGSLDTLPQQGALFNFMYDVARRGDGTYRYQGEWNALDQFIVSSSVIHGRKFTAMPGSVHIMREEFLLEEDKYNPGNKPFRTFVGPRYLGGYSDHLPIVMTLRYQKP